MALKVKREAPASPKAEAKAKALKAKKAMLKGVHTKKGPHIIYIPMAQDTVSPKAAQISSKEHPQKKQSLPLHHQVP
ncbi:hypothetical protein GH733_003317 [Mirounga leonina]|nr:hypothetical protein GH733_003317 [Mirounga leonina]